jgi:hypothetical protein
MRFAFAIDTLSLMASRKIKWLRIRGKINSHLVKKYAIFLYPAMVGLTAPLQAGLNDEKLFFPMS